MSRSNSSKLLRRVEVNLRAFYIFNSDFGRDEGTEENKILYYYPDDIQLNTKMNDIGLSEAIIAFTGNFTKEEECKALHTQKTTQIFHQAEQGFWLVMVLNVPKEIRTKDGVDTEDYRAGEVHDRIYSSVLQQSYNLYRLFNGTFVSALQNGKEEEKTQILCQNLNKFYNSYIQKLKLPVSQFSEITSSVQYLPLEKSLFLRSHNLMNIAKATFPNIKETILLIDDEVVCSGDINPYDLYSLREYIIGNVISQSNPSNLRSIQSGSPSAEDSQNGCFIDTEKKHVFLKLSSNPIQKYYFLVYSVLNATLCLIMNYEENDMNEFSMDFQSFINAQLSCLARDIGIVTQSSGTKQAISLNMSSPSNHVGSPKYLFINEQSLKHITNIPNNRNPSKIAINGITKNILNLIADLKSEPSKDEKRPDVASVSPDFEEIQIKTTNDFWIVKRRCNWREYFVIIFNSKSTLLDITQEAKRIFEQELKEAVFFDK